jgi:hypothetical protein
MQRQQRVVESMVLVRQILGEKTPIDRVIEIVRKAGVPRPGAQAGREVRVS